MEYLLFWCLIGSFAYNVVLTDKVFQAANGPVSFKNKMTLIFIVLFSIALGPITFMMLRVRGKK